MGVGEFRIAVAIDGERAEGNKSRSSTCATSTTSSYNDPVCFCKKKLRVGSCLSNDVVVRGLGIVSRHCVLNWRGDKLFVSLEQNDEDPDDLFNILTSCPGRVTVNGTTVPLFSQRELFPRDRLVLGHSCFLEVVDVKETLQGEVDDPTTERLFAAFPTASTLKRRYLPCGTKVEVESGRFFASGNKALAYDFKSARREFGLVSGGPVEKNAVAEKLPQADDHVNAKENNCNSAEEADFRAAVAEANLLSQELQITKEEIPQYRFSARTQTVTVALEACFQRVGSAPATADKEHADPESLAGSLDSVFTFSAGPVVFAADPNLQHHEVEQVTRKKEVSTSTLTKQEFLDTVLPELRQAHQKQLQGQLLCLQRLQEPDDDVSRVETVTEMDHMTGHVVITPPVFPVEAAHPEDLDVDPTVSCGLTWTVETILSPEQESSEGPEKQQHVANRDAKRRTRIRPPVAGPSSHAKTYFLDDLLFSNSLEERGVYSLDHSSEDGTNFRQQVEASSYWKMVSCFYGEPGSSADPERVLDPGEASRGKNFRTQFDSTVPAHVRRSQQMAHQKRLGNVSTKPEKSTRWNSSIYGRVYDLDAFALNKLSSAGAGSNSNSKNYTYDETMNLSPMNSCSNSSSSALELLTAGAGLNDHYDHMQMEQLSFVALPNPGKSYLVKLGKDRFLKLDLAGDRGTDRAVITVRTEYGEVFTIIDDPWMRRRADLERVEQLARMRNKSAGGGAGNGANPLMNNLENSMVGEAKLPRGPGTAAAMMQKLRTGTKPEFLHHRRHDANKTAQNDPRRLLGESEQKPGSFSPLRADLAQYTLLDASILDASMMSVMNGEPISTLQRDRLLQIRNSSRPGSPRGNARSSKGSSIAGGGPGGPYDAGAASLQQQDSFVYVDLRAEPVGHAEDVHVCVGCPRLYGGRGSRNKQNLVQLHTRRNEFRELWKSFGAELFLVESDLLLEADVAEEEREMRPGRGELVSLCCAGHGKAGKKVSTSAPATEKGNKEDGRGATGAKSSKRGVLKPKPKSTQASTERDDGRRRPAKLLVPRAGERDHLSLWNHQRAVSAVMVRTDRGGQSSKNYNQSVLLLRDAEPGNQFEFENQMPSVLGKFRTTAAANRPKDLKDVGGVLAGGSPAAAEKASVGFFPGTAHLQKEVSATASEEEDPFSFNRENGGNKETSTLESIPIGGAVGSQKRAVTAKQLGLQPAISQQPVHPKAEQPVFRPRRRQERAFQRRPMRFIFSDGQHNSIDDGKERERSPPSASTSQAAPATRVSHGHPLHQGVTQATHVHSVTELLQNGMRVSSHLDDAAHHHHRHHHGLDGADGYSSSSISSSQRTEEVFADGFSQKPRRGHHDDVRDMLEHHDAVLDRHLEREGKNLDVRLLNNVKSHPHHATASEISSKLGHVGRDVFAIVVGGKSQIMDMHTKGGSSEDEQGEEQAPFGTQEHDEDLLDHGEGKPTALFAGGHDHEFPSISLKGVQISGHEEEDEEAFLQRMMAEKPKQLDAPLIELPQMKRIALSDKPQLPKFVAAGGGEKKSTREKDGIVNALGGRGSGKSSYGGKSKAARSRGTTTAGRRSSWGRRDFEEQDEATGSSGELVEEFFDNLELLAAQTAEVENDENSDSMLLSRGSASPPFKPRLSGYLDGNQYAYATTHILIDAWTACPVDYDDPPHDDGPVLLHATDTRQKSKDDLSGSRKFRDPRSKCSSRTFVRCPAGDRQRSLVVGENMGTMSLVELRNSRAVRDLVAENLRNDRMQRRYHASSRGPSRSLSPSGRGAFGRMLAGAASGEVLAGGNAGGVLGLGRAPATGTTTTGTNATKQTYPEHARTPAAVLETETTLRTVGPTGIVPRLDLIAAVKTENPLSNDDGSLATRNAAGRPPSVGLALAGPGGEATATSGSLMSATTSPRQVRVANVVAVSRREELPAPHGLVLNLPQSQKPQSTLHTYMARSRLRGGANLTSCRDAVAGRFAPVRRAVESKMRSSETTQDLTKGLRAKSAAVQQLAVQRMKQMQVDVGPVVGGDDGGRGGAASSAAQAKSAGLGEKDNPTSKTSSNKSQSGSAVTTSLRSGRGDSGVSSSSKKKKSVKRKGTAGGVSRAGTGRLSIASADNPQGRIEGAGASRDMHTKRMAEQIETAKRKRFHKELDRLETFLSEVKKKLLVEKT
eukprot:g2238.t1